MTSRRMDKQENLLKIVKTWKVNPNPEYRGFRCADCQKYLHRAFHHQLNYGGFNTPVHFCRVCEKKNSVKGGILKSFICDNCGRSFYKAYHIWNKKKGIMVETHFCRECFLRTKGVAF